MSDYHIALPSKPASSPSRSGAGRTNRRAFTRATATPWATASPHNPRPCRVPRSARQSTPASRTEFSTIEGVREGVVTILLNIRRIRLKILTDQRLGDNPLPQKAQVAHCRRPACPRTSQRS